MKILHITKPIVEHNGKTYYTVTKMFKTFAGFEDYLNEMEISNNVHTCYFYGVYNTYDDKIIQNMAGDDHHPILFFRFRLIAD